MGVFWKKGYSATSIEDLVEATGVNRYGLYDVYESKRSLFLAALRRYRERVITEAIAELERPGAGLAAIRAVFERIVTRAGTSAGQYGCLLCNTAEEVAPFDDEVAREVSLFQGRLASGFSRAVTNAREAGEVAASTNAKEMGGYLAGLIQGASYLARSPAPARSVRGFVRVGLRVLG